MPDPSSEMRAALERLIQQRITELDGYSGFEPGSRLVAPTNPQGGGPDTGTEQVFTTGYDGAETTLPFTWDISLWDEDYWTGTPLLPVFTWDITSWDNAVWD